ncbi:MAG: hypothetical protein FH753_14785 [Firmicutes bacterium]|nr:hypothetical protein [Bacillota bacterium]
MIKAKCPGSCGELLQGLILGGEKLISYPIDRYSVVTLTENENRTSNYPKAYKMLERVFSYYGYEKKESYNVSLNISSKIPKAKGMASSTSDLAATALVSAKYLGREISEYEIAKLCTDIEPTDSIVFSKITLFDHINGNFKKKLGKFPNCNILLLEGKNEINTLDFHKINRYKKLKNHEAKLNKAFIHIKKGIENKDLNEIGKASIISALSNQEILYKKGLDYIIDLSVKLGAYGVNIAHSGTVIGILYDEDRFDKYKFINIIEKKSFKGLYNISEQKIVRGGAYIID